MSSYWSIKEKADLLKQSRNRGSRNSREIIFTPVADVSSAPEGISLDPRYTPVGFVFIREAGSCSFARQVPEQLLSLQEGAGRVLLTLPQKAERTSSSDVRAFRPDRSEVHEWDRKRIERSLHSWYHRVRFCWFIFRCSLIENRNVRFAGGIPTRHPHSTPLNYDHPL